MKRIPTLSRRHYASIALSRAGAELRSEARRAYLGVLWWVIDPLVYMLAFYVVFTALLNRGESYPTFLLVGLVPWKWFAGTIGPSSNCLAANKGMIRLVYLPKQIFPAVVTLTASAKFLIILCILIGYLVLSGVPIVSAWIALPVVIGIQFVWTWACAVTVAALVPFAPDLRTFIDNGLLLLMFMSGIFFDLEEVPEPQRSWFSLNPMALIIRAYRQVLLDGESPTWAPLVGVFVVAIVLLWSASYFMHRKDRVYPKVIR